MPRLTNRNPAYRHHKASGQAIVSLNGEDVYLGPFGSKKSRREYDRVIGEWLARGRQSPGAESSRRVADVIHAYWSHAKEYYLGDGGKGELASIKLALALLRRTYGQTLARDFGPLALQVVRETMIKDGWTRRYINGQMGRIKRCFKWASSRELIPPAVFHGLASVAGLRQGKTDAAEAEPVGPVADEHVEATLKHLGRQVGAMVRLQLASGMRPGEVCTMRSCDIDITGPVWIYKPSKHKTQHHGHERIVYLGPKAREVVEKFLKPDMTAYLFDPRESEAERREEMHEERVREGTPLSCGTVPGPSRRGRRARPPRERYTVTSYGKAIARACDAAFPPPPALTRQRIPARGRKTKATRWESVNEWKSRLGDQKWAELREWVEEHRWHPHQLRHSAATRLRKLYGLEAARVVLGHRSAAVAEIYAEIDQAKAAKIMGEVG